MRRFLTACSVALLIGVSLNLSGQAPAECQSPPAGGGNHPNGNTYFSSVKVDLTVGEVVSSCIRLTGTNTKFLTFNPVASSGEGALLEVITATSTTTSQPQNITADGGTQVIEFSGNSIIYVQITALATGQVGFTYQNAGANSPGRTFSISGVAAPVTWTKPLTYATTGDQIELSWSVADQVDVRGYELEVDNGTGFATAAFIPYRENGSREVTYTATQPQLETERYYRVKQVDHAGTYDYSNIAFIPGHSQTDDAISVYPNPATGSVQMSLPDRVETVTILSAAGQLLKSYPAATARGGIDLTEFPAGAYLLRASGPTDTKSKYLIIRR
ncbi:hypothetical protein GGR28_000822 [Lewinella aquimaris]|uniref:Secretion system C-terminal sorting domain-containing protein n=1 Tax=Neolewinella aquimaris TaxID=1835722 RepID=A0A840DZ07_9BACT|nr:T9SS type A sorting domain-containing protein [Neolewinella aquimaris]MBB4078221.1 hypothetical protein [Neolewinella aquimaris]